jgi:hypothetical protein
MRRVAVVLALAAALVVPSAAASATIHPLACSELSSAPTGTVAQTQDPPGLTPGGPDQSSAEVAQPTLVAAAAAFKPPGC